MARWYSANVLQTMPGGRRLWRFSTKGDRFVFDQEKTLTLSEVAPPKMVGKDWQSLLYPKLNVAWLPADKVFLRAVQLPAADAAEVAAMVELQLEKLSPLPVTHIVWSFYLMARLEAKPESLQTVIVVIALRSYVEEFLGDLQSQGFLADRIETPGLDQLLAAKMDKDGVWIFPSGPGEPALIAWHYGGAIQNLTLLPLPSGADRGALLKAHTEQISWAAELEGWLSAAPHFYLVAGKEEAAEWEALIRPWTESRVEIIPPVPAADLAAQSAQRTGNNGATTNLLPPEFSARYHQQLVDRLWMRGLSLVLAVYLLAILGYFTFLYGFKKQLDDARTELANISPTYTNSVNDEVQIGILEERQSLKYAALDCYKAAALGLPESVTVERMYFNQNRFELTGTSTSDQPDDVYAFSAAMRSAEDAKGGLLFSDVSVPRTTSHPGKTDWSFDCDLRNTEQP